MFRDRVEELEEEARKAVEVEETTKESKTHIIDEQKAIKDYEEFKKEAYSNSNMSVLETYYMLCGYLVGMNCSGIISNNTYQILLLKLKKEI